MAKAKAKAKRAPSKSKAVALKMPPVFPPLGSDCNLKHLCKYINGEDGTGNTDGLRKFLKDFWADYKALRIAVCNVEKQAFSGNGVNAKPPKFCTGGGGSEPADPPKPPEW